ncbi:MAG: hypothetical protein U0175_11400 [Caldilineaceae bacterium]
MAHKIDSRLFFLLGLLALGLWLVNGSNQLIMQPSVAIAQSSSPLPTPTTQSADAYPAPQFFPTPSPLQPIVWDRLPVCNNKPLKAGAWLGYLQGSAKDQPTSDALNSLYVRQLRQLSSAMTTLNDLTDLYVLLSISDDNPLLGQVLRRDLALLWLNLIDGRLNRATEIVLPSLIETKTIGALIDQIELALQQKQPSKLLIQAVSELWSRRSITNPICAHFTFVQQSDWRLQSLLWTSQGISTSQSLRNTVGGAMFGLHPAPNYRTLAIETIGATVLLDVAAGRFSDLLNDMNQRYSKRYSYATYQLVSGANSDWSWEVLGWHPDSQQLLLGVAESGGGFWVNLHQHIYYPIYLADDVETTSTTMNMTLSPNGQRLLYVNRHYVTAEQQQPGQSLELYELQNGQQTTLLQMPEANDIDKRGRILYPRFSPDGKRIAFLVESGQPFVNLTYTLRLFDLTTKTQQVLLQGDFGWTEPVWSPDSQRIAFAWKDIDSDPNRYATPQGELWRGNIWTISPTTGDLRQITFIDGAARVPIWSLDGRYIAFWTHDGQWGFTSTAHPGLIWQLSEPIVRPRVASAAYLP